MSYIPNCGDFNGPNRKHTRSGVPVSRSPIGAALGTAATWRGPACHAACTAWGDTGLSGDPTSSTSLCSGCRLGAQSPHRCPGGMVHSRRASELAIQLAGAFAAPEAGGVQVRVGTMDAFSRPLFFSLCPSRLVRSCSLRVCWKKGVHKWAREVLASSKTPQPEVGVPQSQLPQQLGDRGSPQRAATILFSKPR